MNYNFDSWAEPGSSTVEEFYAGRVQEPSVAPVDAKIGYVSAERDVALLLKRAIDVLGALVLLGVLSPILITIALAVRIADGAPVVYRQERYGRHGKVFHILKFRTMIVAEQGTSFTQVQESDPRVTRLGAFLRRTSFDELPQLINVLKGEMSLVGPRPHAVAMEEDILRRHPFARPRLDMRPGITGLAQIRGLRGPTVARQALVARLEADVEYTTGWSFWLDMAILLKTPIAWIAGRNAH